MSQTTHDFGRYTFGVNDHRGDQAFITLEPTGGGGLKAVGDGALFLRLRDGVDIRQAEELAARLNDLVEGIEHARPLG